MSSYASNIMDLLWHQRENRNVDDKFHMITSLKGKFDFHKKCIPCATGRYRLYGY